jgi:adenine-specific DNA methylase
MGAIARNIANNITTSGVFTSGALNSSSVTGITVLANASDGITLISSQTASNSASISFTSGLDSTYKAYKFVFVNIHPSVDDSYFQFNASTDSGSNYNVTKTTTFVRAVHAENDTDATVNYITGDDLAQSTAYQPLVHGGCIGNASDENACGSLTLFNPSSTTYVKHFIATTSSTHSGDYEINSYIAGYMNTTSAVNAVRFQMASGNIDAGTIYLYGIK